MAKNKQQIKFEADVSGFKTAIKQAESQITSLNKNLKLNQEQLKGSKSNITLLQDKVALLKDEFEKQTTVVENTTKAYEKAVETFGENSKEAQNLGNKLIDAKTKQEKIKNALNTTNKELEIQKNALSKTGESWEKAGNKITTVGEKIDSVGNKLSVVSAGIVGTAGVALKSYMDYESAFTGVEKTVDATKEQLEELNSGILKMSTEIPSSATEIAAVAEAAGQLGIKTENILSFSRAMIDLGNATNLTSDEAATQLAKFANIMGMSQDKFSQLGSAIVDLGNNYATTEADIVSMAMRLAGAGKQVGFSEGEVLGLATALSSVGIEAEMGGSAISKAMVKMQNAAEIGGEKLNPVLQKAGMSLRELELLSTNDSMGFKELCSSLGMTTTEVKNLIKAGTNLEDFAKVSGMTTEQFKKAWKEDAAGALSEFIKGLGNAEDKGESAIAMLTDMGLTEVRLRDSLLRAANAGNLFNDAIKKGNTAFDENIALANEANKRYATTESQVKLLKNEATKLTIEFGKELAPSLRDLLKQAKPLLDTVANGIKSFGKLDDKTKQSTIKIIALTATLGPCTKIMGQAVKGIGDITSAGGKLIKTLGDTTSSTATLGTKLGAVGIGATALTSGLIAIAIAADKYMHVESEATKKSEEYLESVKNNRKENDNYIKTIDDATNAQLSHMNVIQDLKSELDTLVDKNGKVKEGYQDRVNFILGELNEALGTEYKMNNGVVESYNKISESIDKVILKKKASLIMEGEEEKWTNATKKHDELVEKQSESYDKLKTTALKYGTTVEKLSELQENLNKQIKELNTQNGQLSLYDMTFGAVAKTQSISENNRKISELKNTIEEINNYKKAYKESAEEVKKCNKDIQESEKNMELFAGEHYEELINKTKNGEAVRTDVALQELRNMIASTQNEYNKYADMVKKTDDEVTKQKRDSSANNLSILADELRNRTSTVQILGQDEISAWTVLGNANRTEYAKQLAQMDSDTATRIMSATNIVLSDKELGEAFNKLGEDAKAKFGEADFNGAGALAAQRIADGANSKKGLFSTISEEFSRRLSKLKISKSNENGSHADGIAYVPFNGYVARLHEGERVLSKAENSDYIRNNIDNSKKNVSVNIYAQQISDADLNRISNYINRKWGETL